MKLSNSPRMSSGSSEPGWWGSTSNEMKHGRLQFFEVRSYILGLLDALLLFGGELNFVSIVTDDRT